jgi:hypothetical protein
MARGCARPRAVRPRAPGVSFSTPTATRAHRPITPIGKESNSLEEVQAGLAHDDRTFTPNTWIGNAIIGQRKWSLRCENFR